MKAILSDIHGNLESLQAVLEDAGRHNVEAVYCLERPPRIRTLPGRRAKLLVPATTKAARDRADGPGRREYLFPEHVYNQQKMERILDSVEQYCFHGHTHIPGICTRSGRFHSPAELGNVYWLEGRKTLINVGSVGQPRDGDRRACMSCR